MNHPTTGFTVSVWFERDRQNITLSRDDEEVFSLWDEAVQEAIDDGFLVPPCHPRPTQEQWLQPAVNYAYEQGYCK